MKLSILVPVYNVELYIEQCLKSIKNQTYTDFECIIVNDGSTDKSGEFCRQFALNDARFRVISQVNQGLAMARRVALSQATGDFVGFVDSDDYIDKNMFFLLMSAATNNNVDIVLCDWCRTGQERYKNLKLYKTDGLLTKKTVMQDLAADYIKSYMWNKIFKREVLQNTLSLTKTKMMEDYACMHYIFAKAASFYYVAQELYYYRYRPDSIMTSANMLERLQGYLVGKSRCEFYRIHYPEFIIESKMGLFNHAWVLCKNYSCPKEQESKGIYLDADGFIKEFYQEFIKNKAVGKKERLSLFLYANFTKEVRLWKLLKSKKQKLKVKLMR